MTDSNAEVYDHVQRKIDEAKAVIGWLFIDHDVRASSIERGRAGQIDGWSEKEEADSVATQAAVEAFFEQLKRGEFKEIYYG